jgi:large subunit ribosomal protein L6
VTKGFEKKLNAGRRRLPRAGAGRQAEPHARLLAPGRARDARKGVKVETPTQTEIVIKGIDRSGRPGRRRSARLPPPEPYKGKGVRYADEKVTIKETKKK